MLQLLRSGKTGTQDQTESQDTALCEEKFGVVCEDCEVNLLSLVMRVSLNLMEARSRQQGQEASKNTKVAKIRFKIHMKLINLNFFWNIRPLMTGLAAKLLHPLPHFRDRHSQRADRDRTASFEGIPSACGHLGTLPSAVHCVSLGRGCCWCQASQGLRLRLCLL